jgi:hypothetical protein
LKQLLQITNKKLSEIRTSINEKINKLEIVKTLERHPFIEIIFDALKIVGIVDLCLVYHGEKYCKDCNIFYLSQHCGHEAVGFNPYRLRGRLLPHRCDKHQDKFYYVSENQDDVRVIKQWISTNPCLQKVSKFCNDIQLFALKNSRCRMVIEAGTLLSLSRWESGLVFINIESF